MGEKFTISEVLEVAMEMEKESEAFFRLGAKNTTNEERKKVFNFLVNESRRQNNYFRLLKDSIEERKDSKKQLIGDKTLYLKTLAQESVMSDEKKAKFIIKKDKSDKELINFVKDNKKSMIQFLEHIKKEISSSRRETIEKIIIEEKNHIKLMDKLEESV